jgi:ubiquinone/menaquinone biosynthesis C-methylase UbiE
VLEIGSGTGAFLAEAEPHVAEVVGLDVALRWLHVSRSRFRDRRLDAPRLVCACAEGLPFEDESIDAVVAVGTLEFVRDLDRVFAECARVLRPGGRVYATAVNRHSIGPEPHVRLWGVGWLPRGWQAPYVRWRGRGDFENVRLPSLGELRRRAAAHFRDRRIEPAVMPDGVTTELAGLARVGAIAYGRLTAMSALRPALRRVAPEWEVTLTKSG